MPKLQALPDCRQEIVTAMEPTRLPNPCMPTTTSRNKSDGRQLIDKLGNDEPEEETV